MTGQHVPRSTGYTEFWAFMLDRLEAANINLFSGRKPLNASWMTVGAGIPGVHYAIAASRREGWVKVEILIQRTDAESLRLLDRLREWRAAIEAEFRTPLEWVDNKASDVQRCRIAHTMQFDPTDEERWSQIADWFVVSVPRLHRAFDEPITRFGSLIPPNLEAD